MPGEVLGERETAGRRAPRLLGSELRGGAGEESLGPSAKGLAPRPQSPDSVLQAVGSHARCSAGALRPNSGAYHTDAFARKLRT